MKTYTVDSLPASWTNDGALVTIHGDDGPLICGRIDSVWQENKVAKVALILGALGGVEVRTVVTLPVGARFERKQA